MKQLKGNCKGAGGPLFWNPLGRSILVCWRDKVPLAEFGRCLLTTSSLISHANSLTRQITAVADQNSFNERKLNENPSGHTKKYISYFSWHTPEHKPVPNVYHFLETVVSVGVSGYWIRNDPD